MPPTPPRRPKKPPFSVLVLRYCDNPLLTSRNPTNRKRSFKYPRRGLVTAPDWKPRAICGNGLHGWAWGHGCRAVAPHSYAADKGKWLVIRVRNIPSNIISLERGEKVKYKTGTVIFVGSYDDARALIKKHPDYHRARSRNRRFVTEGHWS